MSRDGSGGFDRLVSDYTSGTTISSSDINTEMDDIATALAASIAKDGQTVTTAVVPFAAGIQVDTISEKTPATGIAVDGVTLKDGGVTLGAAGHFVMGAAGTVIFEGATANDFETTLTVTDPTADRTITLPNATGTVALLESANSFTGANTFVGTQSFGGSAPHINVIGEPSTNLAQFRFFANDGVTTQGVIQGDADGLHLLGPGNGAGIDIGDSASPGVTVGSPTGSFKGAGTINAVTVYQNNVALDDRIAALAPDITVGTAQATTSGTAFPFTGIAAGANRITVMFNEVSLSGTDTILVQIGDADGLETTGYVSSSIRSSAGGQTASNSTAAFIIRVNVAAKVLSGHLILTRVSGNIWIGSHVGKLNTITLVHGGGSKTLSAELTQLTVTRSGTNTFDAGSVNIFVE